MTQSRARAAQSAAEVVQRLREHEARLDPRDGVACVDRLRLRISELTGEGLAAGRFHDRVFVERLDVAFANLYLDAVDAAESGRPVNEAWQPLFEARDDRALWPVQYALAGLNAHLGHDLPLAVVTTCIECRTTPDTPPVHADLRTVGDLLAEAEVEARAAFEAQLDPVTAPAAEPLKHLVEGFSVARARDAVRATTQTLWHERNLRPLFDATLTTVMAGTATAGRMLLTPVLPPADRTS
ncbi:DUF5995 family protein [Kitasatospora sp. NBC_01560]|uniref:DUF5995 family protein n=1 Tax=Kitasatospora sp. NBC_01560 TaxID=2975965 RepID=UPI0038641B75